MRRRMASGWRLPLAALAALAALGCGRAGDEPRAAAESASEGAAASEASPAGSTASEASPAESAASETAAGEGEPTDAEARAALDRVLAAIGVGLSSWSELATADLEQFRETLESDTFDLVVQAARESFEPSRMRERVTAHLAAEYDAASVDAILDWYETPVGRAVRRATEAASDPEATLRELPAFVQAEGGTPPPERLALIRRYNAATRNSAVGTELILGVTRANLEALGPLLPPDERLSPETIARRIDTARQRLVGSMSQQALVTSMFLLRELPDDDLGAHVAFVEAPAFQWYATRIGDATRGALDSASAELRAKVAAIADARRGAPPAAEQPGS